MSRCLRFADISKHFSGKAGGFLGRKGAPIKAVDGVSFTVAERETLGLVGESGCGKSTTGRVIAKLIDPPGAASSSTVTRSPTCRRGPCARTAAKVQMVFQDPYSSLNPRHTIGTIVGAPFRIQKVETENGIKAAGASDARTSWSQPRALQPLPA